MTVILKQTPQEVADYLAKAVRSLRLKRAWTRETLALRAGVSSASLKRFENTGKASLNLVLKVAFAMHRLDEFTNLLKPAPAKSLADLEQRSRESKRKRGSK